MHNITQLTYIAGIWTEYFAYCLIWYNKAAESEFGCKFEEQVVNFVPTWSWFSMPITLGHHVSNVIFDMFDDEVHYGRHCLEKEASMLIRDIYRATLKAAHQVY